MTGVAEANARRVSWRVIGWGGAAALLAAPFVAMRFTSEVNWTAGDFIVAAMLLGLVGLGFELAVRTSTSRAWRGGIALAILSSFLLVWVNGAVGMIGDEGNRYNLLFLGVIALALAGAAIARFRGRAMAGAMLVAGLAQAAIGLVGIAADPRGGVLSTLMAGLWLVSAWLFARAAREA